MKRLSLNTRNVLSQAALLIAMLFVLHGTAAAQWDPPGSIDPCGNPRINCGLLDMGSWVSTAEAMDEANQRQTEGDPVTAFVTWLADYLIAPPEEDLPEDPEGGDGLEGGDGPNDGGNGQNGSQGNRAEYTTYYEDHAGANKDMFMWLDNLQNNEVVHTLNGKRLKANLRLIYRRKLDRKDASQYEAVFLITQRTCKAVYRTVMTQECHSKCLSCR